VGHYVVEALRTSAAPPDQVWRWLADASSWSVWTKLTSTRLVREGVPTPDGVGAIRHFGRAGGSSREEVVAFDPPRHFAYVLHRGLPITNYRSDVTLTPVPGGTQIVWHSEFDSKYPGTGSPMRAFIHLLVSDFAKRLAVQAERPVTS